MPLRTDFSAGELRQLAKRAEDADQARRLLSLAAVLDGMSRKDAAEIGAMDRQTLRDWAHRFNVSATIWKPLQHSGFLNCRRSKLS